LIIPLQGKAIACEIPSVACAGEPNVLEKRSSERLFSRARSRKYHTLRFTIFLVMLSGAPWLRLRNLCRLGSAGSCSAASDAGSIKRDVEELAFSADNETDGIVTMIFPYLKCEAVAA
jgi:hypothetical protein